MLIEKMINDKKIEIEKKLTKRKKSFNDLFDILEYYVFEQDKIEDKKEMNFKVQDICIYLLRNLNKLKQHMAENCLKNSNEHEYINRLDLIIKFLPANVDKTMLKEIKTSLEDDFEPVAEPMPIEK